MIKEFKQMIQQIDNTSSNHQNKIDKLINLLIFDYEKEELDLKTLEQYPNLKNVFVGKDVKRVVGFDKEPEKINSYDINVPTKYKSKSPSGKNQVAKLSCRR